MNVLREQFENIDGTYITFYLLQINGINPSNRNQTERSKVTNSFYSKSITSGKSRNLTESKRLRTQSSAANIG